MATARPDPHRLRLPRAVVPRGLVVMLLAMGLLLGSARRPRPHHPTSPAALTTAGVHALGQQAYLKAANANRDDFFGYSVAVHGDTIVVGAPYESSAATGVDGDLDDNSAEWSGAAYVFVRTNGRWSQQAYLKASNTEADDRFGMAVAISGDTIVVGAPYESSAATGVDGDQGDNSAPQAGAAYVFTRSGTTWSQQAYLKASNAGAWDGFGSVAISGDTIVVGAYGENSAATGVDGNQADEGAPDAGAAYVFVRSGATWSQQAYLKASNTEAGDGFSIVAVDGATIVVGASREDSGTTGVNSTPTETAADSGAAYVFTRSGTIWSQQAYLKASNPDADDLFGAGLAVDGATIIIGALGEDSAATGIDGDQADNSVPFSGAAYVFVRTNGTTWSQQAYLKASNTGAGDGFGWRVAVAGDTAVVSAYGEGSAATGINGDQTDNSAEWSGAAYVFTRSSGDAQRAPGAPAWSQQVYLKASNTDAGDTFGLGLGAAGDTIVVGAPFEQSLATGIDGDQEDNRASMVGAVYVFSGLTSLPTAVPMPTATGTALPTTATATVMATALATTTAIPPTATATVMVAPTVTPSAATSRRYLPRIMAAPPAEAAPRSFPARR